MDKAKPDLMGSRGAQRPVDSGRILAQLEHGARAASPARAASWSIDGWTIGLFALLLLMCCVAWMMHDKTITPKTFRQDYSSTARRATPAVQGHLPQTVQAAAIVNMTSPAMAESGDGPPGGPASAIGSVSNGAATPPTRPLARAVTAQQKAAPAVHATPPAAPAGDTDIVLLTALVAHASKPAAVTPERPRDIVERQDGDSTAQLLARCKQLGLIEGMLCRSRICSGRWESDAACRAPSH
ncbi:hypothetical protein [Duganella sp.]|uniref:hypothetical protein n=1 Tax=Duganella sp. TaxID=1904440 RepID=UPI0031CF71F2